jgi:hypothetical protein
MTKIDEVAGTSGARGASDPSALLPLWPWSELRPARGMLLDSDDFEVLLGHPRATHMLHNAWLHGSGVVWGLSVEPHGEWDLEISPGLAIDGHGRELHLDAPRCLSFQDLLDVDHDPACKTWEVELCLVLGFDACLDRPVPALADPCDVTRESQEYSRVVERARLGFVRGHPRRPASYHRVRVLLGLDLVGDDDTSGKEALAARNEVLAAPAYERARELLRRFRCLAARDAADRVPFGEACEYELFPVAEGDAGIVLGCLHFTMRDESGCPEIVDVTIDYCCRRTVLPTTVIQDLVCALAPGLIGAGNTVVGVGPQAVPGSIEWGPHEAELSFQMTADVLPATLTRDTVQVSSLSPSGWVVEDLDGRPRYHAESGRVIVRFADRPANPLIRVLMVGTGLTPVYGADPVVPLAGVVGDDPGSTGQGRDAILTDVNPRYEEAAQQEEAESGDEDE